MFKLYPSFLNLFVAFTLDFAFCSSSYARLISKILCSHYRCISPNIQVLQVVLCSCVEHRYAYFLFLINIFPKLNLNANLMKPEHLKDRLFQTYKNEVTLCCIILGQKLGQMKEVEPMLVAMTVYLSSWECVLKVVVNAC